ncbi:PREDICTED: fatty-acid amide hydrolase 2-B-like isoform X3 [Dinoponera quadriceps]|uniref:Fatty-acid amide hydrolase 2-B-like isoform X3 n=1 Tax=Dinoponera quadriceps TaxID=609295 RepID=A0A6P3WN90_DINQU|nr:PREDICTED: fatty-acid amide hydrolase 2-B-like isoform X3 [Dinoponera quadriceps]
MYFLMQIIFIVVNGIYLALVWILSFIHYRKPPSIPPITEPLLMISATELAKKIRERKYTSYEVVSAYIKRIKEVNPYLNAIAEDRFEIALTEAKNCDNLLEAGNVDIVELQKQKPLFGIPFTVKESLPVKGLSHTGCTLPLKGRKASTDTFVVKTLRDAGAIPLCVTNTPELCCGFDSYNFLYGRTHNPYDTRYITGGSSGGEAALLGAGSSLIGIGSDIGGSIRLPALFCGIFGFKPSPKVIPSRDHFPSNNNENFQNYMTFGPMTRYADDLSLFMKVISMKSNCDLCLDEPVDWKQMKVYYRDSLSKSLSILSLSPEFKQCILKAAIHFVERDVHTEEIPIEWPARLFEMILAHLLDVGQINLLMDTKNPKETLRNYFLEFKEFKQKLENLLGKNGVLIYPTFRITAPFPEPVLAEARSSMAYCSLANILGFPAVQIPMGLNNKGMPIGFQVIAAPYQDRLCLAAAKELETAFGGWVPPSISTINN